MKNGKRILSVTIKRMLDESPDSSHLGKYGTRAESEYAIDRRHSEDCQSIKPTNEQATGIIERAAEYLQNEYGQDGNSFVLAVATAIGIDESVSILEDARDSVTECDCNQSFDSHTCEFFNPCHENYKGLPEDEIRKYCRQDCERAEALNRGDWYYIGIRAIAEIQLTPGRCSQDIESGGLWGIESDSGADYFKEIETEELSTLKDELRAIGFSARAISTAFKDIQTKEEF